MKKVIVYVMCLVMIFSVTTLSAPSAVHAESNHEQQISEKDMEIAQVISNNLDNYVNEDGKNQLMLSNKEELINQLYTIGSSLTIEEVEQAVESLNELLSENSFERSTCSKALQFIGYVHAGSYAAAAALWIVNTNSNKYYKVCNRYSTGLL